MSKRIDAIDLNVYYGNFLAVEGVNISIEPRSVTAFIGPSGCGKTTLLRVIAGLERATALAHAAIDVHFRARNVYLVLSPPPSGRPARIRVLLDGRPIAPAAAGTDVRDGAVRVTGQRLYQLVGLRRAGQGRLTLEVPPGVSGYAFTFG